METILNKESRAAIELMVADGIITKDAAERYFPELKESERIKDCIGICLTDADEQRFKDFNTTLKDCLDWLHNQGEQNPAEKYNIAGIGSKNAQGKLGEMIKNLKSADKVEPKFHEGDWVIDKQGIVHQIARVVENVTNHTYGYDIVGGGYFNDNTEGVRLWTIQDAKAGDVLACGNDIVIFKENNYNPKDKSGCMFVYCSCNNFYEIGGINPTDYKPATKEQRELLFQKMKEAGYEWDAENKELKKIEHKPAWSEEDEKEVAVLEAYIRSKEWSDSHVDRALGIVEELVNKVKFIGLQLKQEWSGRDEAHLHSLITHLEQWIESNQDTTGADIKEETIAWLKSIKDRVIDYETDR